jgi:hypothetical protein
VSLADNISALHSIRDFEQLDPPYQEQNEKRGLHLGEKGKIAARVNCIYEKIVAFEWEMFPFILQALQSRVNIYQIQLCSEIYSGCSNHSM